MLRQVMMLFVVMAVIFGLAATVPVFAAEAGIMQQSVDNSKNSALSDEQANQPEFNSPDDTELSEPADDQEITEDEEIISPDDESGYYSSSDSNLLGANSMADFKFPFNGIYNNYWAGEVWYISNGYGGGLYHKCRYASCYPSGGYYSIDLLRYGGETRGGAVLAPAYGTVIYAGWKSGYGWCVMMDHGNGYTSIVAHLNCNPTRFVNVGNVLPQGTLIGVAGSSGGNWAAHIHFSVWRNRVSIPLDGISGGARIVLNGRYCSGNQYIRAPTGAVNCP